MGRQAETGENKKYAKVKSKNWTSGMEQMFSWAQKDGRSDGIGVMRVWRRVELDVRIRRYFHLSQYLKTKHFKILNSLSFKYNGSCHILSTSHNYLVCSVINVVSSYQYTCLLTFNYSVWEKWNLRIHGCISPWGQYPFRILISYEVCFISQSCLGLRINVRSFRRLDSLIFQWLGRILISNYLSMYKK